MLGVPCRLGDDPAVIHLENFAQVVMEPLLRERLNEKDQPV